MKITRDILRAWRHPRRVMRSHLAEGTREDRVLMFLMTACLLIFVAQWPRLLRETQLDPQVPFDARIGGALLGWIFIAPLFFYTLAGVSHLLAKTLGGSTSWFTARLALFWALLAASPLWLLNGLIAGFDGLVVLQSMTGVIALAGFVVIWLTSFVEAGFSRGAP